MRAIDLKFPQFSETEATISSSPISEMQRTAATPIDRRFDEFNVQHDPEQIPFRARL